MNRIVGEAPLPALLPWKLLQNAQPPHGKCPKHVPHPAGAAANENLGAAAAGRGAGPGARLRSS